jgi:hypothetical protein
VRRSWYLRPAAAATLAALLDDLHHETRAEKRDVWDHAIAVLVQHADEVRERINRAQRDSTQ